MIKLNSNVKHLKLMTHLCNHENYGVQYRTVNYSVELGAKVTVKRVVSLIYRPL